RRGDEQAFGDQLANDPSATRAERGTNGDLRLAARRADQEEVRDVRAGDEKHEADCAEQRIEQRADVADDGSLESLSDAAEFAIRFRIFASEPLADGSHIAVGLLDRDAGAQACDR